MIKKKEEKTVKLRRDDVKIITDNDNLSQIKKDVIEDKIFQKTKNVCNTLKFENRNGANSCDEIKDYNAFNNFMYVVLKDKNIKNLNILIDDVMDIEGTNIMTIEELKSTNKPKTNEVGAISNIKKFGKKLEADLDNQNAKYDDYNIVYDKMGGRPSVTIHMNTISKQCLLDTGARMNVMDSSILKDIGISHLKEYGDKIWCANGSPLETLGRIKLKIKIGMREENVLFVVVKSVSPSMIGGIDLLKKFDIKLVKINNIVGTIYDKYKHDRELCSIEAGFGKSIDDNVRFKRVIDILGIKNENKLYNIIKRNISVFMADKWDVGKTNLLKHEIKTIGEPIRLNPRRQPIHLEEKIEDAIKNLEDNGIIRKCDSAWNTPLVCVWKKEKKDIRICLDFRCLNKITERQMFPMPNIEQMLDTLNGSKIFSTIDLGSAYYQVELTTESQEKTAFSTKNGQYCFNRMPFGIAAAPATFQKLMNIVLGKALWNTAIVYLDDILIFSKNKEEHIIRINDILEKIKNAGLKLNPDKCIFMSTETKFLGHIINGNGVKVDESKINAIKAFERPKCLKQLRGFLGLCNYYRKFIKDYSKFSRVLESMCGSNKDKLIWSEECEKSFEELKRSLSNTPVLIYPDFNKGFILDTDASFDTIGAVLSQLDDNGNERVVAYGSHTMNKHEIGYCITRKELLAIYYFTQHFKHYLYGKKFLLRTDHKALTFMMTTKKPITPQFQTWINFLSSLDMDIKYRKGTEHTNADILSRNKCGKCSQCLEIHEDPKSEKIKTRLLTMTATKQGLEWQKNSKEIDQLKQAIEKYEKTRFKMDDSIVITQENKIWIPAEMREKFVKEMHRMLCHAGYKKVSDYIKVNYDMDEFQKTIKTFIQNCEICQKRKTLTVKTKEIILKTDVSEPFEVIAIDFCGPLHSNIQGKKYILGIIDMFSRYISLTAVAKQDEKTTADALMKYWILKYGAPRIIKVDCGKTFESNLIKELAKRHNIQLQFSSPYHHSTNGLIERQFRTIRDFICTSIRDKTKRNWVELLPEIEFTLNATKQSTTEKCPAEIIFGFRISREWQTKKFNPQDRNNILEEVRHKQQNLKYNNNSRTHRTFAVNDKVLVKIDIRNKDDDRYKGPCQIIRKIHDRSYEVKDEEGKILIRNVEWLKPFKQGGCKEDL